MTNYGSVCRWETDGRSSDDKSTGLGLRGENKNDDDQNEKPTKVEEVTPWEERERGKKVTTKLHNSGLG